MSRRVVRQMLAKIDDLETELEHVTRERDKFITLDFWKEETCRTQPTDS